MTLSSIETDFRATLSDEGFVRATGDQTRALLGPEAVADWDVFADSWNDLGLDRFMADGGRYRRRRFAAFLGRARARWSASRTSRTIRAATTTA
jgi:hypothetical protein